MARRTGRGVVPSLSGADLLDGAPDLAEVAAVDVVSLFQVPGAHLSISDLQRVAEQAGRAYAAGADGVVVTQGTDTIVETAFFLELTVLGRGALVVTGAMRNPAAAGAEGAANLTAAVQVAASPEAAGIGVLVVLNDDIHAARFVRKSHTSNPAAFESYPGAIGWVSEGRPRIVTTPRGHPRPLQLTSGASDHVALLTTALGDDGRLFRAARDIGCAGLVVEALGGGHVPPPVADALGELCRDIPVVLCSKVGRGEVLRSTYGFVGSETDLVARGVLNGGFLDGPKARIFLTALLRAGATAGEVAEAFADPFPV